MKKKTRDLKKHDRDLRKQLRSLRIDPSPEHWYNDWHEHLDWEGYSNRSARERAKHIQCYLDMLDKVETQMAQSTKDFQTWVVVDPKNGCYDALYFHTENPHGSFPLILEEMQWGAELPMVFQTLIDKEKYSFGAAEYNGRIYYYIQKKGLGKSL